MDHRFRQPSHPHTQKQRDIAKLSFIRIEIDDNLYSSEILIDFLNTLNWQRYRYLRFLFWGEKRQGEYRLPLEESPEQPKFASKARVLRAVSNCYSTIADFLLSDKIDTYRIFIHKATQLEKQFWEKAKKSYQARKHYLKCNREIFYISYSLRQK